LADADTETAVSDEELVALFPDEQLTRENAPIYRGRLAQRLLVNRCSTCGTWHQPPGPICPACWSTDVVATPVAGTGTIWLTVFLYQGPPAEGVSYETPYPVVTVELDEQPSLRVTSTVVDAPNESITIGSRVVLDWIERSGAPLPVWRLS
jgi:uncharacterized OB-fold protein